MSDVNTPSYSFGDCVLQTSRHQLSRAGLPVHLRAKAYALLTYLLENRHRAVSRDELCEAVWPGRCVGDATIASTVKAVRRAVGDNGELQRVVRTISGHGYRFVAAVAVGDPQETSVDAVTSRAASDARFAAAGGRQVDDDTRAAVRVSAGRTPDRVVREFVVLSVAFVRDRSSDEAARTMTAAVPELLREYARALAAQYEGTCVEGQACGVRIYFGYPHALEDAAVRAVKVGLLLLANVRTASAESQSGMAGCECAYGAVVALARLEHTGVLDERAASRDAAGPDSLSHEASAATGTVLVTDAVRRRLRGRAALENTPARTEGDGRQARRLFRVDRVLERPGATALRRGVPLLHRSSELTLIEGRWQAALEGRGQLCLIEGEAGIGKSRLATAVRERIDRASTSTLVLRGNAVHRAGLYYPIVERLRHAFELDGREMPTHARVRLTRALRRAGLDPKDALGVLQVLLASVAVEDRMSTPEAIARDQKTRETLLRWLIGACEAHPLLVVWEGLHWCDPSSLALLREAIEQLPRCRLLVVATCRIGELPELPPRGCITRVALERFTKNQTRELVERLPRCEALEAHEIDEIVARCDGVPLFIEEYVAMLAERHDDESASRGRGSPDEGGRFPASLHDVLVARFDRLDPGAPVVRIASVLGRDFDERTLGEIARIDELTLEQALRQLLDAEILHIRGFAPHTSYRFKHALVQEAAYHSLPEAERCRYHRRIARALVRDAVAPDAQRPRYSHATIAHHFDRAGDRENAVEHYLRAGQIATALGGFDEAIVHLERAGMLVGSIPAERRRDRTELAIILALGAAHAGHGGYSAERAGAAYARARTLCRRLGYPPESFEVLSGSGSFAIMRADFDTARSIASQAIKVGEASDNPLGVIVGRRLLGAVELMTGRCERAIGTLESAVELYERHPVARRGYALDHKTTALGNAALAQVATGEPEAALMSARAALAHARGCGSHARNFALCFLAGTHYLRDDPPERVRRIAERSLALARESRFGMWIGMSEVLRGSALVRQGMCEAALQAVEAGAQAHADTQSLGFAPCTVSILANTWAAIGRNDKALAAFAEARAIAERTGERWYLPEIDRLHARVLDRIDHPAEAERHLCRALALSLKLGTHGWTLRVLADLTRFVSASRATDSLATALPSRPSPSRQTLRAPVRASLIEARRSLIAALKRQEYLTRGKAGVAESI